MSRPSIHWLGLILGLSIWIGCSKDDPAEDSNSTDPDSNGTAADVDTRPDLTALRPTPSGDRDSKGIHRNRSGDWVNNDTGQPFTGTVMFDLDELRWEEKYRNGQRTHVKAWDEFGDQVSLYSWNDDGSAKAKLEAEKADP